ncbi:hypothetical protein CROQUDRAFT_654249, partial [Cronartium quercuum f. sp. fusiforme G11]
MLSNRQSARKRGFSQAHRSGGDEEEDTRCSKIRRLDMSTPPTLLPYCTFADPVVVNPSSMLHHDSSTVFLKAESKNHFGAHNQVLRHDDFLSPHSNMNSLSTTSSQDDLLCQHQSQSHKGSRAVNHETRMVQSIPLSSPRRASLRTILTLSKSKEIPSRLSHIESFPPRLKSHTRTKVALSDLSQTLGRLCVVDELEESTSTDDSESIIPCSLEFHSPSSQQRVLSPTGTVLSSVTDS